MTAADDPRTRVPLRVLLADDSAVVRDRIAAILAAVEGVVVVGQAVDTDATLAALGTTHPDVVVLDLFMPGGGGLVVLGALANRPDRPTVIVFTNFPDQEYREACVRLGAHHFLDKSRDAPELIRLIEGMAQAR
jgi:DNA-binding NarL/FixJ family response regulator